MDIQKLVQDLKAQGLADDKILISLQQMVNEGRLQMQDLEQAKAILQQQDDRQQAQNLFDMKFKNQNQNKNIF